MGLIERKGTGTSRSPVRPFARSPVRSRMVGSTYHGVDRLFVFHHGVCMCARLGGRIRPMNSMIRYGERLRALRSTSVPL